MFIISWFDALRTNVESIKNCFKVQRNINLKHESPFPSHNDAIFRSNCINFADFFSTAEDATICGFNGSTGSCASIGSCASTGSYVFLFFFNLELVA
jgi:hypothetical protein